MKIDIRAIGFSLTDSLERQVVAGLERVLRRGDPTLRRIQVRLRDVNGPRGGADKRCSLRVDYAGREVLAVSRTHADLYAAISMATEAVSRNRDDRSRRVRDARRRLS
ncbi:MAG: HPF/RaiA family ribosome-associated protein [Polyangiales bacterium]